MEKLAILADIHGNLPALEAVVADLRQRGITTVVNLGDHASGPLWPAATLDLLMQQSWLHIAGNHDRNLVQSAPQALGASDHYAFIQLAPRHFAWLHQLPAMLQLPTGLLLCHGTPTTDNQYLLENVRHGAIHLATPAEIQRRLANHQSAVVLCGHSHMPRVVNLPTTLVINPGSVGLPAYQDEQPEAHVVATGTTAARYAVLEVQADGWRVELIALPYDHLAAARQAAAQKRPDWATALATGFLTL